MWIPIHSPCDKEEKVSKHTKTKIYVYLLYPLFSFIFFLLSGHVPSLISSFYFLFKSSPLISRPLFHVFFIFNANSIHFLFSNTLNSLVLLPFQPIFSYSSQKRLFTYVTTKEPKCLPMQRFPTSQS